VAGWFSNEKVEPLLRLCLFVYVRVLILLCSAGLLTYKLLQLQARLDAGLRGWSIAGEDGARASLSQLHGSVVVAGQ